MTTPDSMTGVRRHELAERAAARQAGAVARQQLQELGFSQRAIDAQVRARRWQRVHEGVLLVFSGIPDRRALLWAALLACGPGAVLSHQTAGEVFGFVDRDRSDEVIHVTISESRREVSPLGVRVHRSRLMPGKASVRAGYPVTTAADTVLDLVGGTWSEAVAVGWITAACRSGATSPADLLAVMGRRKRQRHRNLVKAVCCDVVQGVDSMLEHAYLHRVERSHGLPVGRRQVVDRAGEGRVRRDVEYDEFNVVVELDGRRGHEGPGQHRDMERDNDAMVSGKVTLRYGHATVMGTSCAVARQVAAVLQQQGWAGELTACSPHCTATRMF